MIPRDQRRRSPERERRRRADRRHSREQLAAAALAAAAVSQTAVAGPSSNNNRSRANSSTSSSAVTSSDEDAAPKKTGWGFRSFFSMAPSKKVRKRRSFRKKNYSSSSVDSNLAYGGYGSSNRSSMESQRGARRRSGPQRKISQTYSQHSHHDKEYQQHKEQPKDHQYQGHHQQYAPQQEYQRPEYVPQDGYAHSDQTTPRPQHPQPQYQPPHPEPYYRHQHQQYHQQQPHAYQHPAQHSYTLHEQDPELFTPDGRPNLARTKTDEEIIELGRKISDLARASNLRDLERAGKQRPSQLVGAATAISNFRRQNSRRNGRRGLAPSKSKRNEQQDDQEGWVSASDSDSDSDSGDNTEDPSASDSDLAYGSSPHYSDDKLSTPAAPPPPPAISPVKPYVRNKAVDPSRFGPVNSLHGLVTPLNGFRNSEDTPTPRPTKPWLNRFENEPLPEHPTPADELETPMQMVYPVATPYPHRFDAVTSPTLVSGSPLITSRPVAMAIQAPKPRVPVSTRALEEHPMPRQRSADGRHLVADPALAKSRTNAADKHEVIRDDTPPSNYRQHRSRASHESTGSAHPSHASHHSHHSHQSRASSQTSQVTQIPVHVKVPLPTARDLEFDDWHDFEDRKPRQLTSEVPKFTDPEAAGVAATLIGTALFQDRNRRDDEEERNLDPNHVLAEYKQRVQQEEEQRHKAEEAEKERLEKERQEREARAAAAIKREREAREAQEAAEREAREKKEAEERAAAAALELAAQREREEREAREALEKMQREAEERAAAAAAAQRELEALEKARREAQEREVQEAIEKARREALERVAAAAERERQEREHLEKVRREAEDLAIAARRELETRESALEAVAKEARRLRDEADYREQYERRVREAREMQYKEERRMHDARYRHERDNMVIDVEPRHRSTSRQSSRNESPEEKRSNKGKEVDREEHHRPKPQAVTVINERDVPKEEPKPKVEEPTRSVPEKKRESMGDTLNPNPKKASKEERRAKRAETLRLLAEMQKELELEKERARKLAELEAAKQQPKDEEPRKSSPPVVPESSKSAPKDQVSDESKEASAPGPPPAKSPNDVIDPFQFQVPDDAFPTPVYATPARPLTPQIYTAPEPDFSPPKRRTVTRALTDAELEIRERVTRRDSFEIQQRREEIRRSRHASEQPPRKTDTETLTAEKPERERSRSRNRSGSCVRESEPLRDTTEEPGRARSRSRQPSHVREAEPKPDPQAEANKWYRDYVHSRRNERLRSESPNRSVVDKYDDSKSEPSSPVIVTAEPTIITAEPSWAKDESAEDGKPKKSKYAVPNADVRIDHVILPRDLHRFLSPTDDHNSLHASNEKPMFTSRDPSCERDRPLLNLVLPTPAPTPTPERQRRERAKQAEEEAVETKPSGESKSAPADEKKPNYILNARGEIEIVAPTAKDEDNESVKSDGWVEPVADTGLTHVVADKSRQAAVDAIKRALQPKRQRAVSSAWGALGGALLKKVAEDKKAAAEKKAEASTAEEKSAPSEVEEKVEVPAVVVDSPIVEEEKSRELEPETKPADVAAPTKDELQSDVEVPRQDLHPTPEPHPEPQHQAVPIPEIAIQEPESPKVIEEPKYEEPKEELKGEEERALPEGESREEKGDEATRQIVDEPPSSPVKPKRKLPKGVVEPPIFSPYRPTFSDNFADVVCGENPNPDTRADTYTWRRDGVAAEPEITQTSTGDEWESLPRKVESDEDETTTNPKRTFNPDNREPPDRLGKEFSFEVVEPESSQANSSDEMKEEEKGASHRRPSTEFIDFLKNQSNGSTSDRKHDHIITTTELNGNNNNEEQSFLGNAGTHGAGAGSAEDSEAATASDRKEAEAQILPRPNATQASMEDIIPVAAKEEKEEEENKNLKGSDSAPEPEPTPAQQLRHTDSRLIDPEVLVHRPITPAIDPQYGDLLPLPPYPTLTGPGYRYLEDVLSSPLDQLPALPESRPSTPPPTSAGAGSPSGSGSNPFKATVAAMMGSQSLVRRQRERGHTRSRSALEGVPAVRVPSQTAVPIQFRLKGKRSGSVHSLPPPESWGQSPVSRPASAHGDVSGGSGTGGSGSGSSPVRSRPRPTSWESSMREMKPLYLVERNASSSSANAKANTEEEVEEVLPPPESFELPEDDDLDLLPELPESRPESDAGSPLAVPVTDDLARDLSNEDVEEEEVLKPAAPSVSQPTIESAEPETSEVVLPVEEPSPVEEPVLAPETVKLPVDEDLDLLPSLPQSDAGSPTAAPVELSRELPVPADEVLKQIEPSNPVPIESPAKLGLPAPEKVKLPTDEDLDLLPALLESPVTEVAVPVDVSKDLPIGEVPKQVEAPSLAPAEAPAEASIEVPVEETLPAPETIKLPVDEDLDLLPALPESPVTEVAVPMAALAVSVPQVADASDLIEAPKVVETETPAPIERNLPSAENVKLPVDEDLDLLPALPESPTTENALPVAVPEASEAFDITEAPEAFEIEGEVERGVEVPAAVSDAAERAFPALEGVKLPEDIKLPVDEDLDLLPALPESPVAETALPVSSPADVPIMLEVVDDIPATEEVPATEVLEVVETPKAIEIPAPIERELPSAETVKLPVDDDLDLLPALPEFPVTESAVPVSLPAVTPDAAEEASQLVKEAPVAEIPEAFEAPKAIEIPAPVERELPSAETVELPADEDLDLFPALPGSGPASPGLSEPISPVSVGEGEGYSTPAEEALPKPETVKLPEDIKLPVDEDLDLLPSLPDSIATSPTTEAVAVSLPIAALKIVEEAEETPKLVEREVPVPENVKLPVDEDWDLLPALLDSPAIETMPSIPVSASDVEEATEAIDAPQAIEVPVALASVPENVSLPVDEDLDLLPALPESGPASPTKEHASLATLPVIAPVVENDTDVEVEAEPVSEVSRQLDVTKKTIPVLEPESISLPVDEDLDLLPALPESGPASPTKEHASLATSPVVTPAVERESVVEEELVTEKELVAEPLSEVVNVPDPKPEPAAISLPVDEDLDLLPALPESAPASLTEEYSTPESPDVERELVSIPQPEPESVSLPVDEDLDLLPALPESGPASPALDHVSRSASPVAPMLEKEPVTEGVPEVVREVVPEPENVALPMDQDLDLLPALPESAPASPTKEHASLATSPVIELVTEPVIKKEPVVDTEVVPELLPLPKDQDLDLLPALPESEPASPTIEFALPVTAPVEIPQAASETVPETEEISKSIPEVLPKNLPLPKDQDLDLLPALPENGPSSPTQEEFATPVTEADEVPVDKEVEQPSKHSDDALSITIPEPDTVPLPAESDDGLWALPSLPQSREGSGYASPVTATIPVEEFSSPVKAVQETTELPISVDPEAVRPPSDDGLWALPSLPQSREGSGYTSPVTAVPTFGVEPPVEDLEEYFPDQPDQDVKEEVLSEQPVEVVEKELPLDTLPQLPADEDLDLLPELPASCSDSPTAQPSAPQIEDAVGEEVSLPLDEDLNLLPKLPKSRSDSPDARPTVPEAEEIVAEEAEKAANDSVNERNLPEAESVSLPVDEDLDLLPQLPESRSSSPGYELPAAIPEIEQEQPIIDNVTKHLDQPQEPSTPSLSELPGLPADEDLDLLPALPTSRGSSPDLAVSLPVEEELPVEKKEPQAEEPTEKQLDLSELPALPVDEDLELLPELPESRNESPEPQAETVPVVVAEQIQDEKVEEQEQDTKDISPEVLPLPADEDLDLLPELPASRGSTPDQEASQPIAAPEFPVVEDAVQDIPQVAEDLSKLPALPVDEDLDILPALPDSPAVDNFPEEETQTTQLLEEVFTQPAWEETQPTQLSDIVEEELAIPTITVDEVSKDLSELPALPGSRASNRSEDIETAPSLEDPSELPPLPVSREDSPEPKSPLPVLGAQRETESLAKQIAPSREWNEGEIQEESEPLQTPNEIIVGHVRRDSSDAAHPADIYEKPSSHTQITDPNEMDYKLAETIYEDMCEDDASTVAASDAPSFLSGANAEQKEQIAKALAGDSEATSSLSPESSFRVLQYLKKRDAAMKQGQTYEEPEEGIPGPSSQYEDEEEQVPQEVEEALEAEEQNKKAKGVSFVFPEASESDLTPPATENPDAVEDTPADDEDISSDQSTPRQELRIGIPGPSSRVANLEAVNNELENIPDTEESSKASTDEDQKHTESTSNQESSSGEPQPPADDGSILGGGIVAEPERQPRPIKRVSSPDNQWGTLGDLDDLDDEDDDDDDLSEYSPGGTNMKRYSLTRLPTFPGVTAFLGRNFRSNSAPNPSDVPVQDERDYYSSDEREMLEEEENKKQQELLGDELERRLEGVKREDEEEEKKEDEEEKKTEETAEKGEGADESQTVDEKPEQPAESQPEPAQEPVPTEEPETTEKKGKKKKKKKKNKGKGKAVEPQPEGEEREAPLPTTQADLDTTLATEVEEPKEPEPETTEAETKEEAVEPEAAAPASKSKKSKKKKKKKNKSAAASGINLEEPTISDTANTSDGPGLDRHSTWPVVKSDTVPSEKKTAPESESTGEEETQAPALAPKESSTTAEDNDNTTTTTTTTLLPEEIPLPESDDLLFSSPSPTPSDVGSQTPPPQLPATEATGLDTNLQTSQDTRDSLDSRATTSTPTESKHLPSESLIPLPDLRDITEPKITSKEPTETTGQDDEEETSETTTTEREPETETETPAAAKQDELTTAPAPAPADGEQTGADGLDEGSVTPKPVSGDDQNGKQGGQTAPENKEMPQEEPKTEEQPATASPDLASPTSETFAPRLLRRSTAKKEKIKAGKMSNPASPTLGTGWGIASPPQMSLDKALEAADPFADGEFERRMRTVKANREAERSAKIAEKEKLERALFLQRRSTFDVGSSPKSSHASVFGSTSSVAVETGSNPEERPAYALKRASTDRAEKKKKLVDEKKKKSKKSDWPDAWPEDFDEEATMPQEPGHPSMWPELHGRASPSPIRGRSGYRTPTPLGQYMEDGGPNMPPPEPIPEVPSKPIPDVGSDTATPSSETTKEVGGTLKASAKKGRKRRSSSLAVATDKEEDADANNSEAEQADLDTQPSGSVPAKKSKKNKRGRKGKGKGTDSSPAANAEDAEGQEASDGDEEPSSGNAKDADAGAAGDATGKKKRKKNKKKGSQATSGVMSPPLEPNPEVAQLTAQLAQLTDLVQQLVVDKTRSASADPAIQGRSRRSSSVTKGNPKIRRTSSGNGADAEGLYDSDGFSIHDEGEDVNNDDDAETAAPDNETTKAKRFMGVPYRRGSKSSKSDKDKHQQQSSSQQSSTTATSSKSTTLGIPKLGLNSLLGGSKSSGPKEMSTQTSSPEPSPRNSLSKDGDEEESAQGEERGRPSTSEKKYPPSASKPVKSKVRRAMSGLSRTRGAPSLEQIPETEFEDSDLEDGATSPGPKPGMLNRAMTGMSLDKLDFRKPRSSSVSGETDRRPATATDAESINMETASITQPKASTMMKRAFSGMIPTTSKPRTSLDQSETESISGARPSMMKRAMTGMIPGASSKPRSSMESTAEQQHYSGERKMSMGSAFKNFSMTGKSSREPSRTREPTSRGPSIDLGPRETDSTEISPHESPALRPEVSPDPHPQPKPGMMKRALTGLNPAASRPEVGERRESEPVLEKEKEKHKTLDRLTFGMMSRSSHPTATGVGTQTPDSGFNSGEQDLMEPSRPGSGSGSGSSSIHHQPEKSKTNKTMKMLGLGAFTKKEHKNSELVETPPEMSRPGSSGSYQTTAPANKPSRLDRTISGMSLSRPRKSISQETSHLDVDSRPGTGSSMQPPQQPQFPIRPDPSPAPKSRMASFNKVMTLGLIKDKSEKTPTPSHHEPETATQTPMESSASAHSNGSRPTSWNSNQFPENLVPSPETSSSKPSKPQTRMGRAMSALSIPTSRNSVSQERPASSYLETTTSTNLTEPTDVTDAHSHHSGQTVATVTDSTKKEKSKMSFKSVVTLGMASSSHRSSSSRRQSVEHSTQTPPPPQPVMPKLELPSLGLGDSLLGSPPSTSAGLGGTLSPPGTSSGPTGSTSAPPTSYGFPPPVSESPFGQQERQKDPETASIMNRNEPKPGMLSRTKTAMSIGSRKDWNDSPEAGAVEEKEKKKVMSSSAKANWNRALMGTKNMGKMGMGGMGMGGMFGKKKEKEKDKGV